MEKVAEVRCKEHGYKEGNNSCHFYKQFSVADNKKQVTLTCVLKFAKKLEERRIILRKGNVTS